MSLETCAFAFAIKTCILAILKPQVVDPAQPPTNIRISKIVVGKFGKTYGVNGEIIIHSYLTVKKVILNYKNFYVDGKEKIIASFVVKSNKILCKINSVSNPEEAKKYSGRMIFIDRIELPKLNKKKFYYNDLIHMKAYIKKKQVGVVTNVKNHGAGDYLEILDKKKEILVPFNDDHIEEIDIKKKVLFLNPSYYEI